MRCFFLFILLAQECAAQQHPSEDWDLGALRSSPVSGRHSLGQWDEDGHLSITYDLSIDPAPAKATGRARNTGWLSLGCSDCDLGGISEIGALAENVGESSCLVTLWIVGKSGWSAVGDQARLGPGESAELTCSLRETFPDATAKIDPSKVQEIRVMVQEASVAELRLRDWSMQLSAADPTPSTNRIAVPEMISAPPAPGTRVRWRQSEEASDQIYSTLYLPTNWTAGERYPVIFEFPGNIFFHADRCWSTGRPEQCVIGYGVTLGKGAIWVCLPFVDRAAGEIAENGFGSNAGADTVDHTKQVIAEICDRWGGDPDRLFLSGFSRGAIACGYIGLHDQEIAKHWRGFIACQHYDGSPWRQSTLAGAIERAPRFSGEAIFQIDNSKERFAPVAAATAAGVRWTWVESGLNYHDTAMFLDNRESIGRLRSWFADLVSQ